MREAVMRVPRNAPEGLFKFTTEMGNHSVIIKGRMMGGVPRISTIRIP